MCAMFVMSASAGAQNADFTIAIEGVAFGSPGEVAVVAQQMVDPTLVGAACQVTLTTENNSSIHPGNTLIVSSGPNSGEIPGVEDASGQTLQLAGGVVLAEDVTVSLRFGQDGITSAGATLSFACAQPAPTTTAAPVTTIAAAPTAPSTTSAAAPAAPSTTRAAAPVGGVATGAGGTATSTGIPALQLAGAAVVGAVLMGALVSRRHARS